MKKTISAVFLCISMGAWAQLIQLGPQVSYNITSPISSDFASKGSETSIGAAAFARLNLALFFAQGEFGYAQSKFSLSQTGAAQTQYDLSGTDATLLAGVKILPLGKAGNVRIFAGYNWKNYSSIKTDNSLNVISLERNNSSILGGVGLDVWRITFDYRYLAGLSDLDASDASLKTGISAFCVGFKFL